MIRDVLDPRHEAVRQPMGESTAVDDGSLPSAQIMFSAIHEKKEGDCALPPEEGRTCSMLQLGALARPPPPLRKPLKIYPSLSDLRRSLPPPFVPPRAQEFPTLLPKPPGALPEAEEDKEFSERKELLKQIHAQYIECTPWRKPPQGGLTQARKKVEQQGDLEFSMAFPVVITKTEGGSEEEGKREPVPYKLLKELKQACHDYGIKE